MINSFSKYSVICKVTLGNKTLQAGTLYFFVFTGINREQKIVLTMFIREFKEVLHGLTYVCHNVNHSISLFIVYKTIKRCKNVAMYCMWDFSVALIVCILWLKPQSTFSFSSQTHVFQLSQTTIIIVSVNSVWSSLWVAMHTMNTVLLHKG